jgi:dTDP-4-amino-4,6-dideoxygalactose transaminase
VTIPLLDIEAQHAPIRAELDAAITKVLDHRRFVSGPEIEEFEREFAAFCDAGHAIGVSSGTSAITVGLRAAGVKPGDEVITTPFTFIATVESIVEVGAAPVLVDCNPDTALLDPEAVEAAITERTSAILVVHLYGQTVDLAAFRELADRRGLILGEDAAQAHGAKWSEAKAGSVGDFATFSFFPGKNLGCLGDGGAITTGDEKIAARARSLRDHGRAAKYEHDELGTNARLDTLQAAVLSVKLPHLEGWNEARRRHAAAYDAAFAEIEGVEPVAVRPEATHAYHQYTIRLAERDAAMKLLNERGIAAAVHYPIQLSRQPALRDLTDPNAYPNADRLAAEVLSIPVFPELTPEQRDAVIDAVREHLRS